MPQRPIGYFAAFALGVAAAFTPAAVQAAATPTIRIATPSADQLFTEPGSLIFSGSAGDASGVTGVTYEVEERETSRYLHAGGTFNGVASATNATLSAPGGATSSWSVSLPALPNGDYELKVQTTDRAGKSATASVAFGTGPAATATTPGYLTLLFGRAEWVAASPTCVPVPGQPTLLSIAQGLATAQPGLPRTGVADPVTNWVGAQSETCVHHDPYPSWQDLATLRDTYNWGTVSEGELHANMTTLTTAQQVTESCGALTNPGGFYAHGDASAWGMFSYGNNKFTPAIQTGVVANCYAFGRTYKGGRNIEGSMLPNDMQVTNSILGGTCNASPCAGEKNPTKNQNGKVIYYLAPSTLVNLMNVAGGQWVVVQMYKLVTGTCATATPSCGGLAWNCNGAWQTHWTSKPELYCYADYMAAVVTIPANVVTVDPATVAVAWGVNPGVTQKPLPAVSSVTPQGGAPAGGSSVTITGSGFTGATNVAFGPTQATSLTVNSDTQITVSSPAGSGTDDVRVTTTKGLSAVTSADGFTYGNVPAVVSISPGSGPAAGGTDVTVNGTGFTSNATVSFGGAAATGVAVNAQGTQLTAVSPPGAGLVDVVVTTAVGTSATTAGDQFTYAPTVDTVTPNGGPEAGGTLVTITGTGLTNATSVMFGTTAATGLVVDSDQQITATSPAGTGVVDVTVVTPAGTSPLNNGDVFTYTSGTVAAQALLPRGISARYLRGL